MNTWKTGHVIFTDLFTAYHYCVFCSMSLPCAVMLLDVNTSRHCSDYDSWYYSRSKVIVSLPHFIALWDIVSMNLHKSFTRKHKNAGNCWVEFLVTNTWSLSFEPEPELRFFLIMVTIVCIVISLHLLIQKCCSAHRGQSKLMGGLWTHG